MSVRVDNFDVYVNGQRIEDPYQRVSIAVPAVVLGIFVGLFVVFVILPLVGFGLALLLGVVALVVGAVAIFLLFSPLLISALAAIGLFRWLFKE